MGKGFKLRFSLIHSLQFCRSRNPSALPESPAPAAHRQSSINHKALDIVFPSVPDAPPSTPCHPLRRRRVRSVSTGCGCQRGSGVRSESSYDCDTESVEYSWEKEGKWHVISRVYDDGDGPRQKICCSPFSGESDGEMSSVEPRKMVKERKVRKKKKKGAVPSVRTSTSSGDSGWFSSEGGDYEEETETLLSSSRSFSNDSSFELNHQLETIIEESKSVGKRERSNHSKKARRLKRYSAKNCITGSSSGHGNPKSTLSSETPARLSAFLGRMPCRLGAKVRESFAVVKKSNDPYEDFKKSMAEMIMEKQMSEAEDLEQLLHCFLSLNSPQHHGIIVEAFSAVWEHLSVNHGQSQEDRLV